MRIAIVTDAWYPQVNGVVTTLSSVGKSLEQQGHKAFYVSPEHFKTVPCPTYRSIRLALTPARKLSAMLDAFRPEAVHIATEGPLGLAGRRYCVARGLRFTTSYHTQFPQYVRMRAPIPLSWTYAYMRWFHSGAARTMVPTESQRNELRRWGFNNLVIWTRGVDTELFRPQPKEWLVAERPVAMYVGRVAVEKNIEAFLGLELPGSKFVVGDGPDLQALSAKYPDAHFVGFKFGEELSRYMAAADVFVFPSRTDTFGIVLLDAMASGVPVAAYPVTGPKDVVVHGVTGILNEDLGQAIHDALRPDPARSREYALNCSWEVSAGQFFSHLEPNAGLPASAAASQ